MKAYKLVRKLKDGKCYPLFIDKDSPFEWGVWKDAEFHPTKGFAGRQGYHCCFNCIAPHLKEKLANGEQRVWIECEVEDYETYDRPESQGGAWVLAQKFMAVREIPFNEVRGLQSRLKWNETTRRYEA